MGRVSPGDVILLPTFPTPPGMVLSMFTRRAARDPTESWAFSKPRSQALPTALTCHSNIRHLFTADHALQPGAHPKMPFLQKLRGQGITMSRFLPKPGSITEASGYSFSPLALPLTSSHVLY